MALDDENIYIKIFTDANQSYAEQKKLVKGFDDVAKSAQRARESINSTSSSTDDVVSSFRQASSSVENFNDGVNEIPKNVKKAHSGLLSFSNFLRTAFGTLTAIAIFTVLTSIQKFFTGVLKAASDFRSEMAELNLAEYVLSKKGMDITRQEFDDLITYIENRSKFLSKLDATRVVADTAGAVQEFDVTKKQLGELAEAIAFIQVKNKLLGREEANAAQIINAAMDARSNFFNGMGINITEATIKEKAYAMGLVETGKELDKATRFQAVLALLTEQTASKQEELNKQLEGTPLGNQLRLQKEWSDAQLTIGQSLITVRDNLVDLLASFSPDLANSVVEFFVGAADGANRFIDSLQMAKDGWESLASVVEGTNLEGHVDSLWEKFKNLIDAIMVFENVLSFLQGIGALLATGVAGIVTFFAEWANGASLKDALYDAGTNAGAAFFTGMSTALSTLLRGEDGKIATAIKDWWKANIGIDLNTFGTPEAPKSMVTPDTPTGPTVANSMESEQSDLQKALEKMNTEILEAQIKLAQDMEDAAIDLGRKLVDIAEEYARKRAEAEVDYTNKVRDINASYQDKISDINAKQAEEAQKARNDEIDREAEFQNKMMELKENYLMDLEEALHERDARQVLRLMKQYNLDKTQAERDHALEQQKAARDLAVKRQQFAMERAQAEADRKRKLEEAKQDYMDKLAKLKADEEAERHAAQVSYQRRMEDLQREMHNRLALVAAGLVQEFNLTKAGLDAIYKLYRSYYGAISQVYAAMTTMLRGMGSLTTTTTSNLGTNIITNPTGNRAPIIGTAGSQRFAEGGMMIADRPTTVTFGDGPTPEMAQFTPIGKNGRDVNKLFSNMGGSSQGAGAGSMEIGVTLSPDLEARIIRRSEEQTARVITKVNGSKVR